MEEKIINTKNGNIEQIPQVVINRTERPCSFEFGKAGNRFKLYFEDVTDLDNQIKELIAKGYYKKEEEIENESLGK